MVANAQAFKKSSPNGKLTLFMGKRDIVDSITRVEPIEGVVTIHEDYVCMRRNIYVQLVCYFRYGREDDETLGLNFHKEFLLDSVQISPYDATDTKMSKWQSCLVERLDIKAVPFKLTMSPHCPASVILQQKAGDLSQACGIQYFVKVFPGESEYDRTHKRSTVTLGIRKIQYAPFKQAVQPCTVVRKQFFLSFNVLELEVTLDQQLYHHGERVGVKISVRNNSQKIVKRIKLKVVQAVQFPLFQYGQTHHIINSMETVQGCPIRPGSSLQKIVNVIPNLACNQNRFGIAVEGHPKRRETSLASTTLLASKDVNNAFGVIVSYSVKVKLVLGALGGDLCAEVPFALMHPNPIRKESRLQHGIAVAERKLVDY